MLEENKIIESKRNNIIIYISIFIMVLSLIITIVYISKAILQSRIINAQEEYIQAAEEILEIEKEHHILGDIEDREYKIEKDYIRLQKCKSERILYISIAIICIIAFISALITVILSVNTILIVSNKRVYGKVAFGKRVDIPLKSISSIGTGILYSIVVASSSGKICFYGISNYKEIHTEISNLILK